MIAVTQRNGAGGEALAEGRTIGLGHDAAVGNNNDPTVGTVPDQPAEALPKPEDPDLLVGFETADDAAVYRVSPEIAVISTADYITPVVDDPLWFGRVAAANSLSDVWAMGGRPVMALNLVNFPSRVLDPGILREILLGGAEKVRYLELTTEREMGRSQVREDEEFFPHAGGWTALADGRVVVAPERNGYRLEVRTPDGQVQAELTRPYRAWQRTEEEKAEVSSMMGRFGPRNRPRPDFVVLPTEKDILRVRDGGDGTVWVLPSRGVREQPAGVHSTWDVFATDGRWLRQVSVVCEGDGRNDALFFTGDGRAVLVREHAGAMRAFRGAATGEDEADAGEAQPLEIVVYRIVH